MEGEKNISAVSAAEKSNTIKSNAKESTAWQAPDQTSRWERELISNLNRTLVLRPVFYESNRNTRIQSKKGEAIKK